MSARERFFKKVQQSIGDKPIYVNTAEAGEGVCDDEY